MNCLFTCKRLILNVFLSFVAVLGFAFLDTSLAISEDSFVSEFEGSFSCSKDLKSKESYTVKVQNSYRLVKGLEAVFFQSSTLLGMNERIVSRGNLKFLKPGMMDWSYIEPTPQRFVTDGSTVWYYEPGVNQLTIGSIGNTFSSDVPVSFLLGIGDLSESFTEEKVCKNDKGVLITLSPKKQDQNIKTFLLLVDEKNYLPIGVRLVDSGDTSTEFIFKNNNANVSFSTDEFTFSPPKGVDIVYN